MKKQNQISNLSVSVVASISALAMVLGGGIALWTNFKLATTKTANNSQTLTNPSSQESSNQTPLVPSPATIDSLNSQQFPLSILPEPKAVTEKTVELYWVKDSAGEIDLVSSGIKIKAADEPEAILTAAFNRLLSGPEKRDVVSTIPEGTKIQALTVENNGVYIDLSEEFTSGGGSASMMGRLAQVIYTASSLEPDAKVWIFVGGKPLEMLGGEGIEVSQPITRQDFQQEFQF